LVHFSNIILFQTNKQNLSFKPNPFQLGIFSRKLPVYVNNLQITMLYSSVNISSAINSFYSCQQVFYYNVPSLWPGPESAVFNSKIWIFWKEKISFWKISPRIELKRILTISNENTIYWTKMDWTTFGATTLRQMTLGQLTLSIITLHITRLSIVTLILRITNMPLLM
jgi:hypothetical protein